MNIDKNNISLSSMTKLLMMSTLCNGSVTRQGRINNRQMTLGKWQWVSPKLTQNTKEQRVNREVTEGNTQNLIDKGLPPSRQPTGYRRTWDWPLVTTNWKAWPPWPYKGIWNKEAVLKNRSRELTYVTPFTSDGSLPLYIAVIIIKCTWETCNFQLWYSYGKSARISWFLFKTINAE